jgi:hypothetical protein
VSWSKKYFCYTIQDVLHGKCNPCVDIHNSTSWAPYNDINMSAVEVPWSFVHDSRNVIIVVEFRILHDTVHTNMDMLTVAYFQLTFKFILVRPTRSASSKMKSSSEILHVQCGNTNSLTHYQMVLKFISLRFNKIQSL